MLRMHEEYMRDPAYGMDPPVDHMLDGLRVVAASSGGVAGSLDVEWGDLVGLLPDGRVVEISLGEDIVVDGVSIYMHTHDWMMVESFVAWWQINYEFLLGLGLLHWVPDVEDDSYGMYYWFGSWKQETYLVDHWGVRDRLVKHCGYLQPGTDVYLRSDFLGSVDVYWRSCETCGVRLPVSWVSDQNEPYRSL